MLAALRFAFNLWVVVGYVAFALIFGWWLMLAVPFVIAVAIFVVAHLWAHVVGE